MAVGCWLCAEVPAVLTLPNGMHVCAACGPDPEDEPMPVDPTIHTWDGPVPEVERDEDGAPVRPCPGWDWLEDEQE